MLAAWCLRACLLLPAWCLDTCQTHRQREAAFGRLHVCGAACGRPPFCWTLNGWVWQVFKHQVASEQASCIKQQANIEHQAANIKKLGFIKKSWGFRFSVSYDKISSLMRGCNIYIDIHALPYVWYRQSFSFLRFTCIHLHSFNNRRAWMLCNESFRTSLAYQIDCHEHLSSYLDHKVIMRH